MKITDALITELIEATDRDQYGQIKIFNCTPYSLFGERQEEFIEFIKTKSKQYTLSTYGWKYGTYQAVCRKH